MTEDEDPPADDGRIDEMTVTDGTDSDDADGEGSRPESPGPLGDLRDRVVDDADGEAAVDDTDADAADVGADAGEGDRPALNPADESRSGPLGDLAAGVDERRQRKTEADDELFDEVDVGEVDSEALWEQVRADEPDVSAHTDRQIREIDKHKYCQRCPHFSTPPDVGCTHEGTDILEQIDMETFEVADCPIILEDERLEDATNAESELTD